MVFYLNTTLNNTIFIKRHCWNILSHQYMMIRLSCLVLEVIRISVISVWLVGLVLHSAIDNNYIKILDNLAIIQ